MGAPKGNRYAEGLTTSGRPPIYATGEKLEKRCLKYFDFIKGKWVKDKKKNGKVIKHAHWERPPERPTLTGLCLFLGFSSKGTIYEYAKKGKEFSEPVKRALMMVEMGYEENLNEKNSAGSIFALKNFGWQDQQHIKQTNVNLNSKELDDEALDAAISKMEGTTDGEDQSGKD